MTEQGEDHSKAVEAIFVRLFVDPVLQPLEGPLARQPWVTPNRVTTAAAAVGALAAACLLVGWSRLGGLLFVLRFYLDCLDGRIARAQASSSQVGAAYDLAVDVTTISASFACLGLYVVDVAAAPASLPVVLLVLFCVYTWSLAYRKGAAAQAGVGDGGAGGQLPSLPFIAGWRRWTARKGMMQIPYGVELEILVLGLLPMVGLRSWMVAGLYIACCFYALAAAVNLRRIWRIAKTMDHSAPRTADLGMHP